VSAENTPSEGEMIATNRAMWDERVPIHVASAFYDVAGFKAGRVGLEAFEIEEVGDVTGLDLVHLQCHFGVDTLEWARRGARVAGLDFSEPAVLAARRLAAEMGLDAEFVTADVYDAVASFGGRTFDVVYTGLGALNWLPDLRRWAAVVDELLRPGGLLYLSEFHPVADILGDEDLVVEYSYFRTDPIRYDEPGTYTDPEAATEHNVTYEWMHPLSEVMSVLLDRGLVLEMFHEHDHTLFARWDFLERLPDGKYRLPEGMPVPPLMYSLRARKRAS
jgi:SAM-dependent methyltransferase